MNYIDVFDINGGYYPAGNVMFDAKLNYHTELDRSVVRLPVTLTCKGSELASRLDLINNFYRLMNPVSIIFNSQPLNIPIPNAGKIMDIWISEADENYHNKLKSIKMDIRTFFPTKNNGVIQQVYGDDDDVVMDVDVTLPLIQIHPLFVKLGEVPIRGCDLKLTIGLLDMENYGISFRKADNCRPSCVLSLKEKSFTPEEECKHVMGPIRTIKFVDYADFLLNVKNPYKYNSLLSTGISRLRHVFIKPDAKCTLNSFQLLIAGKNMFDNPKCYTFDENFKYVNLHEEYFFVESEAKDKMPKSIQTIFEYEGDGSEVYFFVGFERSFNYNVSNGQFA